MIDPVPDPCELRRLLAHEVQWRDVWALSDDELVHEWRRQRLLEGDPFGEAWYRTPSRTAYAGSGLEFVSAGDAEPLEDLVPKHFVAFEVLDGAGDPYPGLAYVLQCPDGTLEEGTLPDAAQIRRDDVSDESYSLALKLVEEITWSTTSASCGEDVELRGRVSGYPDGTEVEIRIFREFRESDDEVIDTLTGTVEGSQVVVHWAYDVNADHAIGGSHPMLPFVAELRIPGAPGWAKTAEAVLFELPAIRVARWSSRATAPGKAVEIHVAVAGIPDGSPLTIEVFGQQRDGSQPRLDSYEGVVVTDGGVVLPWTYDSDPSDPNAANEAECFFVATSETYLDATRISGPLRVSRAVGRRSRNKRAKTKGRAAPR